MSGTVFLCLIMLSIPGCTSLDTSSWSRWFSTWFSNKPSYDLKKLENKQNVFPIIIIGSGPAGLSAGLYGARAKKATLVIEGAKPGGLLTETSYVENWPGFKAILGKDLMRELKEQAAHFGAQFLEDSVEKVDFSEWPYIVWTEDGKKLYGLSVIIATGASPLLLNIPGEQEYWGKGVATCAICDAPFYQGKEVAVIGGGDSAIAEAIQLAPYAKKVTILVRKEKMRAAPTNQELLAGFPNVSVIYNVEPKKVLGNDKQMTGIELYNNKENRTEVFVTDGMFLAIGHKPNTGLFKDAIGLDKNGYILVNDCTQKTSIPGIFAAGDVEDHRYRQAGVAAGSGIKAALDADMFLNELGLNAEISARLQNTQVASISIVPALVKHVASISEFEQELKETQQPVIVDFYADYCPSCMAMMPHFQTVAVQFKDCAKFISVDIAKVPDVATKYYVNKIPCILIFKDGALSARYSNAMSKTELQELVAEFVGHTEKKCTK